MVFFTYVCNFPGVPPLTHGVTLSGLPSQVAVVVDVVVEAVADGVCHGMNLIGSITL